MDKLHLGQLLHTGVACADAGIEEVVKDRDDAFRNRNGGRGRGRSRLLSGLRLLLQLGSNALGCAVDDDAVLDESLDQPVISTVACDTLVDTVLAKVKISIVTGGAVIVSLRNRPVTAIAADCKSAGSLAGWRQRWRGRSCT